MDLAFVALAAIGICVVAAVLAGIFFFRMVTYEPPKTGKRRKIE